MSDHSLDKPAWRQKQIRERTAACNISFIPSTDQVWEAIEWVNDNQCNEDGMEESGGPLQSMAQQRAHILFFKLPDLREFFVRL